MSTKKITITIEGDLDIEALTKPDAIMNAPVELRLSVLRVDGMEVRMGAVARTGRSDRRPGRAVDSSVELRLVAEGAIVRMVRLKGEEKVEPIGKDEEAKE